MDQDGVPQCYDNYTNPFGKVDDVILRVVVTRWGHILAFNQDTQVMESLPSSLGENAPGPTDPAFVIDAYLEEGLKAESQSLKEAGAQHETWVSQNNLLNMLVQGRSESWPWGSLTELAEDLGPRDVLDRCREQVGAMLSREALETDPPGTSLT